MTQTMTPAQRDACEILEGSHFVGPGPLMFFGQLYARVREDGWVTIGTVYPLRAEDLVDLLGV